VSYFIVLTTWNVVPCCVFHDFGRGCVLMLYLGIKCQYVFGSIVYIIRTSKPMPSTSSNKHLCSDLRFGLLVNGASDVVWQVKHYIVLSSVSSILLYLLPNNMCRVIFAYVHMVRHNTSPLSLHFFNICGPLCFGGRADTYHKQHVTHRFQ
jgi:hypothetical protein